MWFDGERDVDIAEEYLAAGAQHVIDGLDHPFDLSPVERLLEISATGPA